MIRFLNFRFIKIVNRPLAAYDRGRIGGRGGRQPTGRPQLRRNLLAGGLLLSLLCFLPLAVFTPPAADALFSGKTVVANPDKGYFLLGGGSQSQGSKPAGGYRPPTRPKPGASRPYKPRPSAGKPRPHRPGGYKPTRPPAAKPPPTTVQEVLEQHRVRPEPPKIRFEPDGFGVVGLPVNLYAQAPEKHLTLPFLGSSIRVRIWAVRYLWEYGDGGRATRFIPGESWNGIPVSQNPQRRGTATSHIYYQRGSKPVDLRVYYRAAVDWGDGRWEEANGEVSVVAVQRHVKIFNWSVGLHI